MTGYSIFYVEQKECQTHIPIAQLSSMNYQLLEKKKGNLKFHPFSLDFPLPRSSSTTSVC